MATVLMLSLGASVRIAGCELCRIRDETMIELGVQLEDRGDVSVWKLEDPSVLQKAYQEKQQAAHEQKLKKAIMVHSKKDAVCLCSRAELTDGCSPRWCLLVRYNVCPGQCLQTCMHIQQSVYCIIAGLVKYIVWAVRHAWGSSYEALRAVLQSTGAPTAAQAYAAAQHSRGLEGQVQQIR